MLSAQSSSVPLRCYVGIDIAKDSFDAYLNGKVRQWKNTVTGIREFLDSLPKNAYCVMEATGVYGNRLAEALLEAEIGVSVVNPLVIKRFGQMKMRRAKTDRADAKLIAQYASEQSEDLRPFVALSAEESNLEQEQSVRQQLVEQQTALTNQLHALKHRGRPSKAAIAALEASLKHLHGTIKALDKEIQTNAKAAAGDAYNVVISIPGIGPTVSAALITATRSFTRFDNAAQFAAFIGICPRIIESGTSVRPRAVMSRTGSPTLRSLLYMAAAVAIRYNDACIALAKRLHERGKTTQQIRIAVINKLLKQVFGLVKSKKTFVKGYMPEIPSSAPQKVLAF
ncbi:MAG: IS110 family transposase [Gloeotrichia echinulata HAB0833]